MSKTEVLATVSTKIDAPVDIYTNFEPFCEGCDIAELALNCSSFECDNGKRMQFNELTCDNLKMCRKLMAHLKRETEES
jgi:TPP-dependent indolepyruvate ferredoxin oxidoreductase alpha subunit